MCWSVKLYSSLTCSVLNLHGAQLCRASQGSEILDLCSQQESETAPPGSVVHGSFLSLAHSHHMKIVLFTQVDIAVIT